MAARSKLGRADAAAARAARPLRGTVVVRTLGTLSEVADQPQLITLCTLTLLAGLVRRDRRLADTGGRMLAAELLATALKSAIKHRVDRTRPHAVTAGGSTAAKPGHSTASEESSFPSGHTAGAVAVARAIARGYPEHRAVALAAAGAVAAIQVPRCRHYPSDLAAGAAIGLVADALVEGAERLLVRALASPPTEGRGGGTGAAPADRS